jgi:hypothetical protein
VVDAPGSDTNGFLLRDKCVSSTQLSRSILNKQSLSPPEIPKLQEVFLSNSNSILTGKQCARCFSF